jgi:glutamine synthetase
LIIQIETEHHLCFTGNKFEFRAVGSNSNCSNSTTLNAIVAKQLRDFKVEVDALIGNEERKMTLSLMC